MSFSTNGYVHGLVTKQEYDMQTFLFEAFKRTAMFWKLRDYTVEGLNKEEFIGLIKKVAYAGLANEQEISVEAYNQMQTEIQAVQAFCRKLPTYKMQTKLEPLTTTKSTILKFPNSIFKDIKSFDTELEPLKEAYNNGYATPEQIVQYETAYAKRQIYINQTKLEYINSLSAKDKEKIFNEIKEAKIEYAEQSIAERKAAKERYLEAYEVLKNWDLTGSEFAPFKDWMMEQIKTGLTHVDTAFYQDELKEVANMTAEQFFEQEINGLNRNIEYYMQEMQEMLKGKGIK